jgi:hypothetical protein
MTMQVAIMSAALDINPLPPFTCPSANCTFPEFTSIGACSRVTEVTTSLRTNCALVAAKPLLKCLEIPNYSCPYGGRDIEPTQLEKCTFTTTPGNLTLEGVAGVGQSEGSGPNGGMRRVLLHSPFNLTTGPKNLSDFSPIVEFNQAFLLTVGAVQFHDRAVDDKNLSVWREGMRAYEASFELCAKTYTNWTIISGREDSTWHHDGLSPQYDGYYYERHWR